MRIAYDVRLGAGSGVGTILRNVIPLVAAGGHQITLIGRSDQYGELARAIGAELVEYRAGPYSISQHATFPRTVRRHVDVLHVPHYVTPVGWNGALVSTINDLTHLDASMPTSLPQRAYVRLFVMNALRFSKVVLTLSETSRTEIVRQFGASARKVRAVHCGINHDLYTPSNPAVARSHADTLSGEGIPYLLFLSSVRPHKNLDGLLRAFQYLKKTFNIPHRLMVTGERDGFILRSNALSIDADIMRDVVFTGFLPENVLPHLYSFASAFVFPSFSEGFGLPPLEAMSCGAPVIASNASSLPEVLGDAAEYVDPSDHVSIANGIQRVISSPEHAAELVARGFAQSAKYSWQSTADAYVQGYRDAIALQSRVA